MRDTWWSFKVSGHTVICGVWSSNFNEKQQPYSTWGGLVAKGKHSSKPWEHERISKEIGKGHIGCIWFGLPSQLVRESVIVKHECNTWCLSCYSATVHLAFLNLICFFKSTMLQINTALVHWAAINQSCTKLFGFSTKTCSKSHVHSQEKQQH